MKTAILLVLLLTATPTLAAENKIHCDSVWLSNENVLSSDIQKAKQGGGGVPIGTVIAWPFATDPDEGTWLECNGQAVPEEMALHERTATTPNYSGMFLRGTGGNAAALGVEQGDAIRDITGSFGYAFAGGGTGGVFGFTGGTRVGNIMFDVAGQFWQVNFYSSRVVPTANENRPINKAVRYLIRAD